MAEHRVPMLGSSWRRFEDPAHSRDPRVQAVVGALATLPVPGPRPEFRSELRAQLVAITPRIVAESAAASGVAAPARPRPRPTPHGARAAGAPSATSTGRPASKAARHADRPLGRVRTIHWGRPLGVAASVLVVFALLLGGAVWMSRKALPGDTLYGLKRASERLQLVTAGGNTDKASDYLDFAATRAQEVKKLLSRTSATAAGYRVHAAGGVDAGTAALIGSTLTSADNDLKAASRLLGTAAVQDHSAKPLDTMITWAPGQLQRLSGIIQSAPDSSVRARASASEQLVRAALERAMQLQPEISCSCLGSSGSDQLGPKPCTVCQAPADRTSPQQPTQGGTSAPGGRQPTHGGGKKAPAGVTTGPSGAAPNGPPVGPSGNTGSTPGSTSSGSPSSSPSQPGLTLPSLPLTSSTSPTPPVTLNSCGAGISLPILGGIGLGLCSGVNISVGK